MSESTIKIVMGMQKVPVATITSLSDSDLIKEFGFNFFDTQHLLVFLKIALGSTAVLLFATTVVYLAKGSTYDTYFNALFMFLILSILLLILTGQLFRYKRKKTSITHRILMSRGL